MIVSPLIRVLVAIGALAGLVALFGLGDDREAGGEPIHIAFAGPTSGPSAQDGLSAVRAINLIFDEVNARGGIGGRPLTLDVYDDANEAERARTNAPSIADRTDTVAVVGHNYSSCSIAAGEVYASRGIPAVATASTNVAVTRDNDWYFRTIYNDRDQGRYVTLYIREVLGAASLGVIHETATYGAFLGKVIAETAPEAGLTLRGAWDFDHVAPRLDERLDAIVRAATRTPAPDALALAMQPEAGVKLVKRLRDVGFEGAIVVGDALASQAFADGFNVFPAERARRGFYTNGVYASTPFLFDTGGRRASGFLRRYVERYDRSPDWYAAFAADAAIVLVDAMQRIELSPSSDTIVDDRAALRDALASIGVHEPADGITGPVWFDEIGDPDKPVPMGRFSGGQIVSAFAQLRPLAGVSHVDDLDDKLDPSRVVTFGERLFYRTDVAHVGVRARRFGVIDFSQETFELEFDLWFRHHGDQDVESLEFTNAVEPIELGEPLDAFDEGSQRYRLYRIGGTFRADTVPSSYGEHVLALSFRPQQRTRDDLVLALDEIGMNLTRERTRDERGARARSLLAPDTDWTIDEMLYFEDQVDDSAFGHPSYMKGAAPVRRFSQLTIGARVRSQGTALRDAVPPGYQRPLLALSLVALLLLSLVPRDSFPRVTWFFYAAFSLLLILVGEPVVGNAVQAVATPYQLGQIAHVFHALWWLVPAIVINVGIDRFLWRPARIRSGHPVPTVLRYFVAVLVYVLAVFAIIAFVYDYKLTGLLATSGVLAMIFGLAVQLNITNIFAGVALNMERPFKVGDWIMIHGRNPDPASSVIGMVTDINWRTTRLTTADDTAIVIPNGVISEKTITNFMGPKEMSRFELFFTVDQKFAPDDVVRIITDAVIAVIGAENDGPLADPAPTVRIHRATENGIEYAVRYRLIPRLVSPHKARHTLQESIIGRLHDAGITLAYPKRLNIGEVAMPAGDD